MSENAVFRDIIKESRQTYFVEYQPADTRFPFAHLGLVFLTENPNPEDVSKNIEKECLIWLKRFPVVVMISAFNATEDLITLSHKPSSHLMAYVDSKSGEVISKWEGFNLEEVPNVEKTENYFKDIYKKVPYRLRDEVRQEAQREARSIKIGIWIIVFFTAIIPVLIEAVAFGVSWLGNLLALLSILIGVYKIAKICGWLKQTPNELRKSEKELKMRHYYYHCELNPKGFNRLKTENFNREAIEATHAEAKKLATFTPPSHPKKVSHGES